MKQKLLGYEAPSTTIFVVKVQKIICTSPGAWDSAIVAGTKWDDDDDYGLE